MLFIFFFFFFLIVSTRFFEKKPKPGPLNPLFFTVVSVSHTRKGGYWLGCDAGASWPRLYTDRQSEGHPHIPAAEVRLNLQSTRHLLSWEMCSVGLTHHTLLSLPTGRGHCADSSRCRRILKPGWRTCLRAYKASGLNWRSSTPGLRSPKRGAEAAETWPLPGRTQR